MNRCYTGSALFSLFVYSACLCFLVSVFCGVILPHLTKTMLGTIAFNKVRDIDMAIDLLLRDVWNAPCDRSLWYFPSNTMFVWKINDTESVGWLYTEHKGLQRIQGIYDAVIGAWHAGIYNMVSPAVHMSYTVDGAADPIRCFKVYFSCSNKTQEFIWGFHGC